ncbi:RNA polymerase sigma factor [Paucisalibacillus globulus]|uniref:RNA polymerase sigma factor n=1 Tax=Paucisalibacillus globulus TaxID=351095 RepID=UPI00041BFF5A|nr:RNA polymerase sigma factor [Paucisalibacillus globulus]
MVGTMDISEIYTVHYNRLVYQINAMVKDLQLAEDVVQETFIKVMKNSDTIQSTEKIAAWLSVIARRTAIDMIRYEKSKKGILMDQDELLKLNSVNNQHVENEVELSILVEDVEEEILELGTIYRNVMVLKIKELKTEEIASRLNLKLSTVKTRISRARKHLKVQLQNQISA